MEPEVNLLNYKPSFWLPLFKSLTFKTRIIKTNLHFFKYLSSDGIFIHPKYRKPHPKDHESLDMDAIEETPEKPSKPPILGTFEAISNKNNDDLSSNQDVEQEDQSFFPEFDMDIEKAIVEFDQHVFVKLNWKAPKDIDTWVPRLQCLNIEDVLMSLKSSAILGEMMENLLPKVENVKSDVELEEAGGLELVMRKWYDINKAMEFRVFVRDGRLRGVTQRYMKNAYRFLVDEEFRGRIGGIIGGFYEENVKGRFPDLSFTMDVYIESKVDNNWRVWIVDFNPWGNLTNPLLFDWDELSQDKAFEFRVITKENHIVLDKASGLCQLPVEFQGDVSEDGVKKWIEGLREEGFGGIE